MKKNMKMKYLILSALLIVALTFTMVACGGGASEEPAAEEPAATEEEPAAEPEATEPEPAAEAAVDNSALNIPVIAKGFQHQFWQVVKQGAEDAAAELGVGQMEFNGPGSESEINVQVDMINAALAQNPNAICLAALDTDAVKGQLDEAVGKDIPIIGFDSGVPDAPEGSIKATASTDNENAAALAAEEMMNDAAFKAAIEGATADNPVTVAVLSQDATSTSIIGRTKGYLDKFKELVEAIFPGGVAITGHDMYAAPASDAAVVNVFVQVPPTPDAADMKNGAQAVLSEKNLVGVFLSNEGAVTGFLNATNDGADLGDGKTYADLIVAGFDAGATQKKAVRDGLFLGAVTQDPYQIGYQAVALAVAAANGEPVQDVDTGAKWYTSANMDDPDIAQLIYD
ncbi:MAG: substrate-binding domain-containing protein [Clostridiales Family XIII bacterium]|jgi:ribose transport system substrate-binding protein|nr:substrate-binding domain-containing protein [Clostridiales Family XIII bacterium]